jgi:RNA polymerase sigma-70 factor (ECF subfamily)
MPSGIARLLRVFPSLFEANGFDCAVGQELSDYVFGKSFIRLLRLRLRSDEDLVVLLLADEPDALTVLFERYGPLVFRIARRILRNDTEAEDAVQQVFLDMFRSAEQFEPDKGSFKSWLLMFAYHRTFNRRRQLRTRGYYDSDSLEDVLPEAMIEGANRSLPFSAADTVILVEEVLKLIQPRQRRAIELTYYEGLTAEQVSEVTGESVRIVRHNIYRGLEKLRSVLCGKPSETHHKDGKWLEQTRT